VSDELVYLIDCVSLGTRRPRAWREGAVELEERLVCDADGGWPIGEAKIGEKRQGDEHRYVKLVTRQLEWLHCTGRGPPRRFREVS